MVDFDRQTDERGGHNIKEKVDERKKGTSREIVVLLK